MDRFRAMQIFESVARWQNFSRAACELELSNTAVSRAIQDLENHLGVQLFNRTTRKVVMTDQGSLYLERCKKILLDLEEAEEQLRVDETAPSGKLRINGPVGFGEMRLGAAIAGFRRAYPNIDIDMRLTDRYVDVVDSGFDVVVRIASHLTDSSLIAREITTIKRGVYIGRELAEQHDIKTPQDLVNVPCLRYMGEVEWRFSKGDEKEVIRPAGWFNVDSGALLVQMAQENLGVAKVPEFYLSSDDDRLVPILQDYEIPTAGVYLLYPRSRRLSVKVKLLTEFLRDYLNA